jgi:hypothetical protein
MSMDEDVAAALVAAMRPSVPVIDLSSSEEDEEVPVAPVRPPVAVLGPSVVPGRPPIVPVRPVRGQRRPGPTVFEVQPMQTEATGPVFQQWEDRDEPALVDLDVDAACFMMRTSQLIQMTGPLARPAKRRIQVRDSDRFKNWVHIISDPVVVKVEGGEDCQLRQEFKRSLCSVMRRSHGLALTENTDELVLSQSSVNVSVQALIEALGSLDLSSECRVQCYGMKWSLVSAEALVDALVRSYIDTFQEYAIVKDNRFDIGSYVVKDEIMVLGFGVRQSGSYRRYRRGEVHEMLNFRDLGSIEFMIDGVDRIALVKIYQVLVHEILCFISRTCMDDMPVTIRTMRIRLEQLETLLVSWESYDEQVIRERLTNLRVEVTVTGVDVIQEARDLCVNLDIMNLRGIQRLLGGAFDVRTLSVMDLGLGFRV